ncbi:MAG: ribosome maturation factor RimP [Deltaproteobacteria bacterium]|nr:ribosome maturation factor RimP [Deltaproteobacteria bacterium]
MLKRVEGMLQPLLESEGLSLVDIEYKWERGGWVLRVYIDKEGGVTVDDCVQVNKELGQLLDVEDIIPTSYSLEVSSPGLDRPLKKEEDFIKYSGKKVRIKTRDYVSGRRNFKGDLLGCAEGKVMVKVEGREVFMIPLSSIIKANLEIEMSRL